MEKVRDRLVHRQPDLMIIPVASQDEFVSLTLEMFPENDDGDIFGYGAGIYRLYCKQYKFEFLLCCACVLCVCSVF